MALEDKILTTELHSDALMHNALYLILHISTAVEPPARWNMIQHNQFRQNYWLIKNI